MIYIYDKSEISYNSDKSNNQNKSDINVNNDKTVLIVAQYTLQKFRINSQR